MKIPNLDDLLKEKMGVQNWGISEMLIKTVSKKLLNTRNEMSSVDYDDDCISTAIIDNGSCNIKLFLGHSKREFAKKKFNTQIVKIAPKNEDRWRNTTFVGGKIETTNRSEWIYENKPIKRGLISNWDDIEAMWHHSFYNELRIAPEETPVIHIENPFSPKRDREKMTQIMFETFSVPAFYVSQTGPLALNYLDKSNGIVIDCGSEVSHIMPVFNRKLVRNAIKSIPLGGKDVTNYLMKLAGDYSSSGQNFNYFNQFKENCAYISRNCEKEREIARFSYNLEKDLQLPNGQIIRCGTERFDCSEILFQPELIDVHSKGLIELLVDCLNKCDENIRMQMQENITLIGGSSCLLGFEERLKNDLNSKSIHIKTLIPTDPEFAACAGGRTYISNGFLGEWIRKEEYDEWGPSIIHKKCE